MMDAELDALRRWLAPRGLRLHEGAPSAAGVALPPAGGRPLALEPAEAPPGQAEAMGAEPAAAGAAGPEPAAAEVHRLLAEHSGDLIMALDGNLVVRHASPAVRPMLGWSPADLRGRTLADLLVPDQRASFITRHFTQAARHGGGQDLFEALHRDGGTVWLEARVTPLPEGHRLGRYVVNLRDGGPRQRAEAALAAANRSLATQATTDALTGLANRRQFDQTLSKEWFRAQREGQPLALLMIDIDHFKALNDLFGHPCGDAFLARIAAVIRQTVQRAGDLAARYGGEEFSVVLPGTRREGALELAERIRQAVARTGFGEVVAGGYRLSVSVGVAIRVPASGAEASELLKAADAALYRAKRDGRNRVAADG